MNDKSKHYTSSQTYTDMETGMTKQFTFIDHDIKKYHMYHESDEEREQRTIKTKEHLNNVIDEILQFPAIYAALPEDDIVKAYIFTEIISSEGEVKWEEKVLREVCIIDSEFAFNLKTRLLNHYIKPKYKNKEFTHEQIMSGKWKKYENRK